MAVGGGKKKKVGWSANLARGEKENIQSESKRKMTKLTFQRSHKQAHRYKNELASGRDEKEGD